MPGPQAILSNLHNALRGRPITASSVRSVTHSGYPLATAVREGLGRIEIAGGYTGQADTLLDIRISTGGATPRVSEPVYIGPGSHRADAVSADVGVNPQTVTLTLLDVGTDDRQAALAFYGVTLRWKTPGAGGNNGRILVDPSNGQSEVYAGSLGPITRTATTASVLEAIPAGTRRLVGSAYNFGGRDLTASGELHPDTPRLQFGTDPQVYRQYRAAESGEVVWYFGQETARDIPAGTLVYTVTGGYLVTITDGTSTERYADIVTLYDLLAELLASDPVEVDGIVLEDRTPTGMASDELPLRTEPTVLRTWGEGSDYAVTGGQGLTVTPTSSAPTETVTLTCQDNETVGRERWTWRGSVTGPGSTALTTGVQGAAGPYQILIPVQTPEGPVSDGEVSLTQHRFQAETTTAESYPIVCEPLDYVFGARASAKTFTFTYTKRPTNLCDCTTVTLEGRANSTCLGIDLEDTTVTTLATGHAARLADLTTRHRAFVASNVAMQASGELNTARLDVQLAASAFNVLHESLQHLYGSTAVLEYPAWQASTEIQRGEIREPSIRNGYLYRYKPTGSVNTATTASTEPDPWPTVVDPTGAAVGSTITDGGGDWVCVAKTPESQWDDLLATVYVTDLAALEGIDTSSASRSLQAWPTGKAGTPPGSGFLAAADGTIWQILDTSYNAGSAVYPAPPAPVGLGNVASASSANDAGDYITVTVKQVSLAEVTDGATDINTLEDPRDSRGITAAIDAFVTGYRARVAEMLAWAGVDLGKTEAGGGANAGGVTESPCWSDPGSDYYWRVTDNNGTEYLPYFTNRGWHSARAVKDPDTGNFVAQSTQEVWLGMRIACADKLTVGDQIQVTLGNIEIRKTYQPGDRLRWDVIGGQPPYLQGGQTGNNTTRWGVTGSEDGRLTDYINTLGAEADYNLHGMHFTLYRTGRNRTLGEQIRWSVEQGQWQYSTDDGDTWSALAEIPASGAVAVVDGLEATFVRGAAPSFADGDLYRWQVRQPIAADHLLSPGEQMLRLPDSGAVTYTVALDAGATVEVIALALHTLPDSATVTATLRDGGAAVLWTGTLAWSAGPMLAWLDTAVEAATLELSVSGAGGAWIGWLWAGVPLQTSYGCSDAYLSPAYLMGGQTDGRQMFFGAGLVGEFVWDKVLSLADLQALFAVIEHAKRNGNEPLLAIVDDQHLDELAVVRIDLDRTQTNTFEQNWRADRNGSQWAYSLRLPFAPVYAR